MIVKARGVKRRFEDIVPALAWKKEVLGTAGVVIRERDGKPMTQQAGVAAAKNKAAPAAE